MEGGGTNLRPKVTLAQLRDRWIQQQQLEQKKQEERERKQQQEQKQQEAQGQEGTGEEAQPPSKNHRRRRNSMEGGGTNLRPKVTLSQLRGRWIEQQQLEQKKQEERERKQQQEQQQQEAQGQEGTGEEPQPPSKNSRRRRNSHYNRKPKVTFPSTEMVSAAPAAAVSTEEEVKRETSVGGIEKDGARTAIGVGKEKGNAYAGTGEYVRKRGKSVVHRPKAGNVWAVKAEQKTQKVGVEQKTQKVVKVYNVGVIKAEPETQKVEVEQKPEKEVEIAQKKTENAEERVGGTVETVEPKIGKMFTEKGDDKSERKAVVINHRNRWFNSGVRRGYDGLKRGGYGGSRGFRDFNNGGNVLYRETNGRFNTVWGRKQKDDGKVWVRKEDAVTEGAGDGGVAAAGGSGSR